MRTFWKMLGVNLAVSFLFIASTTTATTNQETSNGPQVQSKVVTASHPGPSAAKTPHCGVELQSKKTSRDSDWNRVDLNPKATTVQALTVVSAPTHKQLLASANKRFDPELLTYTVQGYLVGFKRESDLDFHIVIADLNHTDITMIVEMVSPACLAPQFKKEATGLRTSWEARFGKATPKFKRMLAHKIKVEITGVGFYDFLHGQTGVAANGMELHRTVAWREVSD